METEDLSGDEMRRYIHSFGYKCSFRWFYAKEFVQWLLIHFAETINNEQISKKILYKLIIFKNLSNKIC